MSHPRLTLSFPSFLLALATFLLLALLWQLQSLVIILMTAIVLAASITPIVDWAEHRRIPRLLSVIAIYLGLIGGFTGLGLLIGPTVVQQTEALVSQLPIYLETFANWLQAQAYQFNDSQPDVITQLINPEAVTGWVIRSSQQLVLRSVDLTRGIVGGVFSLILVLLISGYMAAGSRNLIQGVVQLFPSPWDRRLENQFPLMGHRMGSFIQGRVLVSAILGVVITIGLSILGMSQFALALGVIAGVTDLIPFVGPILGAVPALIVALPQGGLVWLWVLLLFAIVQNLETYVLDPLLVGQSVKVHPLYQLLAVLGGTQVLGVIGALIVPPWIAGAAVLLENLYLRPKLIAEKRAERERNKPNEPLPLVELTRQS